MKTLEAIGLSLVLGCVGETKQVKNNTPLQCSSLDVGEGSYKPECARVVDICAVRQCINVQFVHNAGGSTALDVGYYSKDNPQQ